MSESTNRTESVGSGNPTWAILDGQFLDDNKPPEGFVAVRDAIYYPKDQGLARKHHQLLNAMAVETKGLSTSVNFDENIDGKGGSAISFFVEKSKPDKFPDYRDVLVKKANDIIAAVGGNKFVPTKLS